MNIELNVELKVAIIRACDTQIRASILAGIPQSYLSHLVRGYREPTAEERRKLKALLGRDYFLKESTRSNAGNLK